MAGIQLERDTRWMLEQWARWARSNPELARIDYPSIQPYTRMVKAQSSTAWLLNENDIILVDRKLAQLKQRDDEMGRATILFYWFNGNISAVARALKLERRRAGVLVTAGTAWIDGCLASVCE